MITELLAPKIKMRNLTFSICILFLSLSHLADAKKLHYEWIRMDSIFINKLKSDILINPLSVKKHLRPDPFDTIDLGYGYKLIEENLAKGYVGIRFSGVYKDNKLISFKLDPQMPSESQLTKKYLSFYEGLFEIRNKIAQERYWFLDKVIKPINWNQGKTKISGRFVSLMSPFSSTHFNTYTFSSMNKNLSEQEILLLLHSINPVTRIYAAIIFYRNITRCKQKIQIEKLIEKNYLELREIRYFDGGCIIDFKDAKDIIKNLR